MFTGRLYWGVTVSLNSCNDWRSISHSIITRVECNPHHAYNPKLFTPHSLILVTFGKLGLWVWRSVFHCITNHRLTHSLICCHFLAPPRQLVWRWWTVTARPMLCGTIMSYWLSHAIIFAGSLLQLRLRNDTGTRVSSCLNGSNEWRFLRTHFAILLLFASEHLRSLWKICQQCVWCVCVCVYGGSCSPQRGEGGETKYKIQCMYVYVAFFVFTRRLQNEGRQNTNTVWLCACMCVWPFYLYM